MCCGRFNGDYDVLFWRCPDRATLAFQRREVCFNISDSRSRKDSNKGPLCSYKY